MGTVSELKKFFEEGAFNEKKKNEDKEEIINEPPKITVQSKEEETPTTTALDNELSTTEINQIDEIIELEINKLSERVSDKDHLYETIVQNEEQKEVVKASEEEPEKMKNEEKNVPQPKTRTGKSSKEQINEAVIIAYEKDEDVFPGLIFDGNMINPSHLPNNADNDYSTNNASCVEELVEIRNIDWHTRITMSLEDVETVKSSQEVCSLIQSLKYSESKYLDDLKGVVSVYLFTIKRHSSELIKARSDVLSERVEKLLECQQKFHFDLLAVHSVDDLSACFTKHTQLIYLYEEFLVDELGHITTVIAEVGTNFKKEVNLKDMLTSRLNDYNIALKEIANLSDNVDLTEPIKRVTRVASVFGNIQKPSVDLKRNKFDALEFKKQVPSWVFIDCHMDDSFGNYLLKNTFVVSSEQDDNTTFSVHLYSKVMLFTKENEDSYYYQKHISMKEIGQPCIEQSTKKKQHTFSFVQFTKSRKIDYKFKKTSKEIAQLWLETIEDLLKKQQDNLIKERQVAQLNQ